MILLCGLSAFDRKAEFLRWADVLPMIFPGWPVGGGAAHARKLTRTAGVAPETWTGLGRDRAAGQLEVLRR